MLFTFENRALLGGVGVVASFISTYEEFQYALNSYFPMQAMPPI